MNLFVASPSRAFADSRRRVGPAVAPVPSRRVRDDARVGVCGRGESIRNLKIREKTRAASHRDARAPAKPRVDSTSDRARATSRDYARATRRRRTTRRKI